MIPGNVARRLTAPVELDGYWLPVGIYVVPSMGLIQRSERYYPEPAEFRPDQHDALLLSVSSGGLYSRAGRQE